MGNLKYSLVVPFTEYNENLSNFILSLNKQENLSKFEIIFIYNNETPKKEEERKIKHLVKAPKKNVKIYPYYKKFGPSQSWCFGIKKSKSKYVFLVASDCILGKNWTKEIIKGVKKEKFILGRFDGVIEKNLISKIEREIDRKRFKESFIDFRNFGGERKFLIKILKENFRSLFFSDVELDILNKKKLKIPIKKISKLRILNTYPKNMYTCQKRKFKHGIGCGRIYKGFELKINVKRTLTSLFQPATSFIKFVKYSFKTNLSLKEKIILTYLHSIFFIGFLIGTFFPKRIIKQYYLFHFDE